MRAIIDVESSGLGPESFPVSVAWRILETGEEVHFLVRPAPTWRGWQDEAQAIHGLARSVLQRDGLAADEAGARLAAGLAGITVYSDAPALDQRWLDRLAAESPGIRAPPVRRLAELFPGADARTVSDYIEAAGEGRAPWKALANVRRMTRAVALYEARRVE